MALCHHRLGDADQARDCWHRAQAWHDARAGRLSPEQAEEMQGFRAEAEAVLARPGRARAFVEGRPALLSPVK